MKRNSAVATMAAKAKECAKPRCPKVLSYGTPRKYPIPSASGRTLQTAPSAQKRQGGAGLRKAVPIAAAATALVKLEGMAGQLLVGLTICRSAASAIPFKKEPPMAF